MLSEEQVSKQLMVRGWSITYFEGLEKISAGLKELGSSPDQALQLIEASSELKDADFRAAAFDLLELRGRTGKSSREAETYIKELDSKIASKQEQSSDWTGRIEKAKGEFRDWDQKRNVERAKFEGEQAQNKRILKEDRERLNRELSENSGLRESIKETISLKADLKSIGLDLPTFKAVVRETVLKAGISPDTGRDIQEDVKRLGSLYKAIAKREAEEKSKTRTLQWLDSEIVKRRQTIRKQDGEVEAGARLIAEQSKSIAEQLKLIKHLKGKVEKYRCQFEFFELFISMLTTSPSAAETLPKLELKIQGLNERGWMYSTQLTLAQRRGIFIFITMGLYLHSIHCGECGTSFIINKAHNAYSSSRSSYYCPVCDSSSYTKPDDTFFDLMLSPELGKKLQDARNLLDIIEKMDPETLEKKLKFLDLVPNEVYEALSQGRRIEVKILDATDQGKEL